MIVKVLKELEYLATHQVEIGILAIDKTIIGENNVSILEYAIYNEYGTVDIPARPFMRNTLDNNKSLISKYINEISKSVVNGELTGKQALIKFGERVRGLIVMTIATAEEWAAPNATSTLRIKTRNGQTLNTKPLLDNRYLIKAIRYQIVNENGTLEYLGEFEGI